MNLKLNGIDHIEWVVKSLAGFESQLPSWGFSKVASVLRPEGAASLWLQGQIRFVVTQAKSGERADFLKNHGDGIWNVAFQVDDSAQCFEITTKRGAQSKLPPKPQAIGSGEYTLSRVAAVGDVCHSFVSRQNTDLFSPDFEVSLKTQPHGFGMFAVDHLTCNLPKGELNKWAEFYEKVFEFKETRFFHISTGRTGLLSKVMENAEGTVKIPLNEPTDSKSQIQEYIDVNHGSGIQHLAFITSDICQTLPQLRKVGQAFLDVPDTYYDEVPNRVKGIQESLDELKRQRILADGDQSGYLLQIFSQNVVGPFFYEVIQRRGNRGFGEGNFKALFEAIERDQERRGVL